MPKRRQTPSMTEHTRRVLDCIIRHKTENGGDSPSFRELMEETGDTSTSVVHFQLRKLERMGLIALNPNKPRCIRVIGGEWVMNGKEQNMNIVIAIVVILVVLVILGFSYSLCWIAGTADERLGMK